MEKISEANISTYRNHRAEPYFTFVKNGQKTIEGRIKKGNYALLKSGDHIVVYNQDETDFVEVSVISVRDYTSIREMLENEQLNKVLPDVETIEQGVAIYNKFYDEEQQKKFGIVAIEVERL